MRGAALSTAPATAAGSLPGIKREEAYEDRGQDGKVRCCEIRGRSPQSGEVREVRVSPAGAIPEGE